MSKSMPSIQALEILAVSDPVVFESLMERIGLKVEGRITTDPLETQVQTESVAAIASGLTEDINESNNVDRKLSQYKQMAEDYGYIVGYI